MRCLSSASSFPPTPPSLHFSRAKDGIELPDDALDGGSPCVAAVNTGRIASVFDDSAR
jgi:hypothetical protein